MPAVDLDKNLHEGDNQQTATRLAAGAVGVVTAGIISGTTNAGAAPTVAVTDCTDRRGNFTLSPVTGGGAQAAGVTATVRFVTEYGDPPSGVIVNVFNETAQTAVAAGVTLLTAAGFGIGTTVLTTAQVYRVTYAIIP
jgi:hypothetical protein